MKKTKQEAGRKISRQPAFVPFSKQPRSAGILMHITSLPSAFAIGDMGPQAFAFADFLHRSGQSYWQVLPINSTSAEESFSPYGSNGSFAGNVLLISPEQLQQEGWLTTKDIGQYRNTANSSTDYETAKQVKEHLLGKAFANFKQTTTGRQKEYIAFCKQENDWLQDYALFLVLKHVHQNQSWQQWPDEYKNREATALQQFAAAHKEELDHIRWQQWIFQQQWQQLKKYCNERGINIFGDLPFYVAYDSADVSAHRSLFHLDKNGNMISEGGAPPDDFNTEGQRWGMPVYRWANMKKDNFEWWINRLRKNMAQFDLLRLDHFRGFSAYWEINVNAGSAKDGQWKSSPGKALFSLLQKKVGPLQLVAENLGSIDAPVTELRRQFIVPGMTIQQVAFDENVPQSRFMPHHHTVHSVVYTGNHDNNTTIGWMESLSKKRLKTLADYTGRSVSRQTVCDVMCRLIYASVARLAILPMQDVLELGSNARMNSVSGGSKSWGWRMKPGALTKKVEQKLQQWCFLYDRMQGGSGGNG